MKYHHGEQTTRVPAAVLPREPDATSLDQYGQMRARLASLPLVVVLLSGCVSAPQEGSISVARAASAAQRQGDWAVAARLWKQAIQKENGFWASEFSRSPRRVAVYHYELGRSLGVLAQYQEAEKNLLEALHLDEKYNGPKGMDLVELARLNHARGDNIRAASFFDRILPRLGEAAEADPATTIALVGEAADVYQTIGQTNRAAELKAKAERLSTRHPNAKLADEYGWTPYKTSAP